MNDPNGPIWPADTSWRRVLITLVILLIVYWTANLWLRWLVCTFPFLQGPYFIGPC